MAGSKPRETSPERQDGSPQHVGQATTSEAKLDLTRPPDRQVDRTPPQTRHDSSFDAMRPSQPVDQKKSPLEGSPSPENPNAHATDVLRQSVAQMLYGDKGSWYYEQQRTASRIQREKFREREKQRIKEQRAQGNEGDSTPSPGVLSHNGQTTPVEAKSSNPLDRATKDKAKALFDDEFRKQLGNDKELGEWWRKFGNTETGQSLIKGGPMRQRLDLIGEQARQNIEKNSNPEIQSLSSHIDKDRTRGLSLVNLAKLHFNRRDQ